MMEQQHNSDLPAADEDDDEDACSCSPPPTTPPSTTATNNIKITKECVAGGPIACVSLRQPRDDDKDDAAVLYYGHGPFLHRTTTTTITTSDNSKNKNKTTSSLLVFARGGSLHGIRHVENGGGGGGGEQLSPSSTSSRRRRRPPSFLVVFGGRKVAFVREEERQHENGRGLKLLAVVEEETQDGGGMNQHHDCQRQQPQPLPQPHLTVPDWIWDCRLLLRRGDDDDDDGGHHCCTLLVGLAHNTVQVWSIRYRRCDGDDVKQSTSTTAPGVVRARLARSIPGTTRSISYCMDLLPLLPTTEEATAAAATMVAVGTVTNDILVWSLSHNGDPVVVVDSTTGKEAGGDPIHNTHTTIDEQSPQSSSSSSLRREREQQQQQHRLRGHRGVIHAVRWDRAAAASSSQQQIQQLVSTSDDRSVRLWNFDGDKGEWVLQWTAWGHTARGWNVAFGCVRRATCGLQRKATTATTETVVLSTGEDGTMRVWDVRTGRALAVARGHACQCVWSVDTAVVSAAVSGGPVSGENGNNLTQSICLAVTGGNDGSVAFYNLHDRLKGKHPLDVLATTESEDAIERPVFPPSWQKTFLLPDDRPPKIAVADTAAENSKSTDDAVERVQEMSRKQKAKRRKLQQQVVVGMQFTPTTPRSLVVATRSGSVMRLDPMRAEWTELLPWSRSDGNKAVEISDGCCMSLHPTTRLVAIGSQQGEIVISCITTQQSSTCVGMESDDVYVDVVDQSPIHNSKRVLDARKHRSVQRLEWLNENELLSFHVQSIVWWRFQSDSMENETARSTEQQTRRIIDGKYITTILLKEAKGMAISYAFDPTKTYLVVGDTRGNLSLFHQPQDENAPDGAVIIPISVELRVHQKEHINAIAWQTQNRIFSVGNDGRLVESTVVDGRLVKLLSVPVGSFTGLTRIWGFGGNQVAVGGYHGNRFAIVDATSGYEYFSFDTGGRQRLLEVWVEEEEANYPIFPVGFYTATCISRRDGRCEIEMQCSGIEVEKRHKGIRHCEGVPLHGESIFDICLFPLDQKSKLLALLTGSEDCSSKISVYHDGVLSFSKLLPPHVSGIRAVCYSRIASGSTIMCIGGKVEVQLFLLCEFIDQSECDILVRNLGFGRPPVQPSIDQRLNSVKAAPLDSESGEDLLVVTGDSSGSCFLYRFSCLTKDVTSNVKLFHQDDRPIISVEIVKYGSRYVLLLGTTAGEIIAFDLPCVAHPEAWAGLSNCRPILRYSAHSMGTNTISAKVVEILGQRRLRICSGGDDQSICCCDVAISSHLTGEANEAAILETCREKGAAISALKGVEFVGNHHLVATGYDQRLSVWRLGDVDTKILFVADAAVEIGDINCLAHCDIGSGKHMLAAGGAGVELFSIDISDTI